MKSTCNTTHSVRTLASRTGMLMLAVLLMLLTGCDSAGPGNGPVDGPVDDPKPSVEAPAPTITLSSLEVPLADGSRGLQFFAQASSDVYYRKATIEPPPPFKTITHNLSNTFVIEEETIALQESGTAYVKVGGSWTFTFEVNVGTGANAQAHTVTVTHGVAGKRGPDREFKSSLRSPILP